MFNIVRALFGAPAYETSDPDVIRYGGDTATLRAESVLTAHGAAPRPGGPEPANAAPVDPPPDLFAGIPVRRR